MAITKVWIEEGCIVCNACEAECPDVFLVTADSCHIKAAARVDGAENENREAKAALKPDLQVSLEAAIVAAAAGCPVSVIVYEQVATEAPKAAPLEVEKEDSDLDLALAAALGAPAPKPEVAPTPKVEVVPAPKAEAVAPPQPQVVPISESPKATSEPARITKVWIEEGCIVCNACEAECGEVFHVTADSCHIKADSRVDGKESENRAEKAGLKPAVGEGLLAKIIAASAGCPVDVIKYEVLGQAPVAAKAVEAAPVVEEKYVLDYSKSPNRQIGMPKTAPLPSFVTYQAEVAAQKAADEAKWVKAQADYEVAKAKAVEEGKPEPKAPVKPSPKKDDNDMKTPWPSEAKDADLLRLMTLLGAKVEEAFEQAGELTCQVHPDAILEALTHCHSDSELKFEMLADQSATHYPVAKDFDFSIVYHLTSISRSKRLRLRILVKEGPVVDRAISG